VEAQASYLRIMTMIFKLAPAILILSATVVVVALGAAHPLYA